MSLNYRHFLIPDSPEARADGIAVARFINAIIRDENSPEGASLAFHPVSKGKGSVRTGTNPFTGETMTLWATPRRSEKGKALSSPKMIVDQAATHQEYNVVLSGIGIPRNPPLVIGSFENRKWQPFPEPYSLEIQCCVRATTVRLDYGVGTPRDEDCAPSEHPVGIYQHPIEGDLSIPGAGCGAFWIEFEYGKFLVPQFASERVDILAESIVQHAKQCFGCGFLQAFYYT